MNNIEGLKTVIRDLHGCDSTHVQSVPVHETYRGKIVWDGDVEVFLLVDHLRAKRAYAWSYRNDFGQLRHMVVLGRPPINSGVDAVRASIGVESQKTMKSDD